MKPESISRRCWVVFPVCGFFVITVFAWTFHGSGDWRLGLLTAPNTERFIKIADFGFPPPNELKMARQNPILYLRGWFSGRPRRQWSSAKAFPLEFLLQTYQHYKGARVFMLDDLREVKVEGFVVSAYTSARFARAFEKMLLTNGVVFLHGESNTVWVVSQKWITSGGQTPPHNAEPHDAASDLRTTAERGSPEAQVRLAKWHYEHKEANSADRVEAFKWASVAAAQNSADAKDLVRELQLFCSSKEQADGEARARALLEYQK